MKTMNVLRKRNYINFDNDDQYDFDEKLERIRKKITNKKL